MYAETVRRVLHAVGMSSQPSEELIDVLTHLLVSSAPTAADECPGCVLRRERDAERARLRVAASARLGISRAELEKRYGSGLSTLRRLAEGEPAVPEHRRG